MKLPQFLDKVDEYVNAMSCEETARLIHEIARTLPEGKRDAFLETIENCVSSSDNKVVSDDGYGDIVHRIDSAIVQLEKINEGEKLLYDEFNEEWDDWYNNDVPEILFSDPDELLTDIQDAIYLVHKSFDMNMYFEGCTLSKALSSLVVSDEGDYEGDVLNISGLYEQNLLSGDLNTLIKEMLYLTYMGNAFSSRAEELYKIYQLFRYRKVGLEDLLQIGNQELPDFTDFLKSWITHLGKQEGKLSDSLIDEAFSMVQDDSERLDYARDFSDKHPSLYLNILSSNKSSVQNEQMTAIGLEALGNIPANSAIRNDIALSTAYYAGEAGMFDIQEQCWLEAFKSKSSIVNYLRIKFLARNPNQYTDDLLSIISSFHEETDVESRFSHIGDSNSISTGEYAVLMLFENQFEPIEKLCVPNAHYYSQSYGIISEALSLIFLLLFRDRPQSECMKNMLLHAQMSCSFHSSDYFKGTSLGDGRSDSEVFLDIFSKWKETVVITSEYTDFWLQKLNDLIESKTSDMMKYNNRNQYGSSACCIAALGEVVESLGHKGAKQSLLQSYKNLYPRRRAFIDELKRFGLH